MFQKADKYSYASTASTDPKTMASVLPGNPRAQVFYCDSSGVPSGQFERRYSTLAAAVAQCVPERGDVIYVGADHTENIGASDLTINKNGVTIIGLGKYANKPTFTLTATGSTFSVTADDVTVHGLAFAAGIDNITAGVTVTGKGCTFAHCTFRDGAYYFATVMLLGSSDNDCDGFVCENCLFNCDDADCTNIIKFNKDAVEVRVTDNVFFVNLAAAGYAIGAPNTEKISQAVIAGNWIHCGQTDGDDLIDFQEATACTGIVANNFIRTLDTDGTALIATGMGCFENYTTAVDNKSGFILPAVDS